MKMITDYFSLKSDKNAVECASESDDGEVYYEARKIKIRLADPNVPDSFVCEIYDTSVEEAATEEVSTKTSKSLKENLHQSENGLKKQLPSKRSRCRRSRLNGSKASSSSDDDEALISVRKRLRAHIENKAVKNGVLRTPNLERSSSRTRTSGKIADDVPDKKLEKGTRKNNLENVKAADLPLAPVFKKSVKKSKEEVEVLKARRKFLHSGLPNVMRKKVETLKAQRDLDVPFFPEISHVQQKTNEPLWKIRSVNVELKDVEKYQVPELIWKSFNADKSEDRPKRLIKKMEPFNMDKLKKAYKNVDVSVIYNALENSYKKGEKNATWPEKYQPTNSDVLGCEAAVSKLKSWLSSWKRFGEWSRDKETEVESSDDFQSDTTDEKSFRKAPPKACLLQGPVGCGKTAMVRALAAEMDLHILEINSSSKRSGKKMLSDLQEATKSQEIIQDSGGSVNKVMSVIVVEEADVVFDQDEGFTSGLQTLITTAKRPVLMLTNDASAPHLEKFRHGQTLQLTMKRPQLSWSCAILEIITLLEGGQFPRSLLTALLHKNNFDLRKCILELQFWVQNGKNVFWDDILATDCHETNQETKDLAYYDNLSFCDLVLGRNCDSNENVRDSCSLSENMTGLDKMGLLKREIQDEILRRQPIEPKKFSKSSENRTTDELLQLVPKGNTHMGRYADYLPVLREICRSEEQKQQNNTKRGNRYLHYLQPMGFKATKNMTVANFHIFAPRE